MKYLATTSHASPLLIIFLFLQVTVSWAQSDRGPSRRSEAPAALLYSNGPFVSHPGQGFGGADASRVQNVSLGMSTFAYTASAGTVIHLADDFSIPAGVTWRIDTVTVYAYQNNSPTTSPFTDGRLQIRRWDTGGFSPGQVIFGNLTTNRIANTYFTNTYRDSESAPGAATRPIMAIEMTVGQTFTAGNYFIDFQVGGSPGIASGAPPVTIPGQTGVSFGGSFGFNGSGWIFLQDASTAGFQDLPFLIKGYIPGSSTSIAGRVLQSAGGRGVTNAIVTLTGQGIQPRSLSTGRNGAFAFQDLAAGQTYTITVTSRRYQYSSQTVQVSDPLTGMEFLPLP